MKNSKMMCGLAVVVLLQGAVALGAEKEEQFGNRTSGAEIRVTLGDWVSGIQGDGVKWADAEAGHAVGTLMVRPERKLTYWLDRPEGHVVAIEIEGGGYVKGRQTPNLDTRHEIVVPRDGLITFLTVGKEIKRIEAGKRW